MRAREYVATGSVLLGAAALLHHVGRTWGASPAERRMPLPGDGIVPHPFGSTTHAVDVDAPPERVWPWIVQMGYHRAGWYTPDWVDHWIWRIDNPSADRVVPELQHLAVGDIVPDGEPGTAFYTVAQLEPARVLVLRSDSHVPVPLRPVMRVLWTWAFVLQPREEGRRTRLLLRARATGSLTAGLMWHLMVVPSDFVMARSMLHGIRDRAQRTG